MKLFLFALLACCSPMLSAQGVPAALQGRWRVDRVLAHSAAPCWDEERARQLLGSTLGYGAHTLRWQGGEVPLIDEQAVERTLTIPSFADEYGLSLSALGIHTPSVREITLQHEDADVTGGSTEVPGDTVLLASPGRIVFSTCGVYFQAVRAQSAAR